MSSTKIKIRIEFCGGGVDAEKAMTIDQDEIKMNDESIQQVFNKWLADRIADAHSNYLEKLDEHFDRLAASVM